MDSKQIKVKMLRDGRSMKWFYDRQIKEYTGLSYSGFMAQLNGYTPVTRDVRLLIQNYMETVNET